MTVHALVSERVAAALRDTVTPQGVVAVVETTAVGLDVAFPEAGRLLVVVEDRRTWQRRNGHPDGRRGWPDAVILDPPGSVDVWSGKSVRASAGSVFHLPLVTDVTAADVLERARSHGSTVLATAAHGDHDLDELIDAGTLAAPTVWVFGNEAHGVSDQVRSAADQVVGSRSTAGPRASTSLPPQRSAFTPRPARSGAESLGGGCGLPNVCRCVGSSVVSQVTTLRGSTRGGHSVAEGHGDGAALDDLPDGVVVAGADRHGRGRSTCRRRILGAPIVGPDRRPLTGALPLVDPQGRDWWECTTVRRPASPGPPARAAADTLARAGEPDRGLLVTASYVREDDGRLSRVVVCLRDTRARARQERSGAELVSVVAHELRSPLTSVKGFTATLLAKWERFNDEQKLHMLRTVNSDADRLTRLISELLDVSRIETGRLELRKQVVDLPELVRRDIASRVAAGEAESRFVVQVDGALPELWADPDKLAQVVGNIVENALRHGGGTVTVTVGTSDGNATVEVTDEGDGIKPEALPRIFTKFWHDARRGGTGLGLFIAKGIVEAHGGSIEAGNADGWRGGPI